MRTNFLLPVDLAGMLAIRLQAVGLLDELLTKDEKNAKEPSKKWTSQHWSPLQGLCALFSHSDTLSTSAADICAEHAKIVINIMKDNGPASSQEKSKISHFTLKGPHDEFFFDFLKGC